MSLSRRRMLALLKGLTLLGLGWIAARLLSHLFLAGPGAAPARRRYLGRASDIVSRIDGNDGRFLLDEEHKIVLFRAETALAGAGDDALKALSILCTHLGCTLRASSDGRSLECPCHGSRFSLAADDEGRVGAVLCGPATSELPDRQVIRHGDRLFVES